MPTALQARLLFFLRKYKRKKRSSLREYTLDNERRLFSGVAKVGHTGAHAPPTLSCAPPSSQLT